MTDVRWAARATAVNAGAIFQPGAERLMSFKETDAPKEKTRPGGQPDGSSHMGAWGGWALAPNMTDGEG